ncbi:glycosyltransferase family 2 protein [Ornithinimicrobium sp. W1679]|uniref:glycosyltransferase family 2 protein n=1 Tax=Ornithinimicrobium sp. W1679 TaxID=3418770 RepID=UPI003CFA53FD
MQPGGELGRSGHPGSCAGVCHAVVILNFHGRDDTVSCLRSMQPDAADLHFIVVDNGSYDGVLDAVRAVSESVTTVQSTENLGFAGGMNLGIDWATRHGARVVTILNNDTILHPGALDTSRALALDGYAVSPTIVYDAEPDRVWFAGGTVDPETNLARHLQADELQQTGDVRATQILAGCCVTASVETWARVGGFDEGYFLNFEDSEWSIRATRAGVLLVVDTSTTITHKVSRSFRREFSYLGLYFYVRNGLHLGRHELDSDLKQSWRFLRRHVVPIVAGSVRDGSRARAAREAVVVAAGLSDFIRAHRGPAPRWLQRRTLSWSSASANA